ncbi:hypothetical protein AB0C18_24770 [Nonomuraea muscovyensis]|uniref:hypothetical protein n=1 Tax=Nonomuraea muscovyensis TaxID=1124761 RepID=UPI003401A3C7
MRRPLLVLATAAGLGLAAVTASPASAVDTTVTFTITAGELAITAPASVNLASVATGAASVSGEIGPITVTDERGTLDGAWTATVTGTDFTTGGATPSETIGNINLTYAPGDATGTTGTGTFTPGAGGIINVPRTAFTGTALTGNNSATWNPTITLTLPATAVAGTYTGTVTHSVA